MRATQALWAAWFLYWWLASRGVKQAHKSEATASRGMHLAILAFAFLMMFSDLFHFGLMGRRLWPAAAAMTWAGLGMTAAGMLFTIWARVHLGRYWSGEVQIKEGHRIIMTGPYALVRHPIYTGFLLAILGSAVTLGEVRGLVIIAATSVAFWRKVRIEEAVLAKEFGGEYAAYRGRTKALIPFLL
jgi:protein-S-isoprenylcysteine O-methyltransferase Ste14